jgi:hypothetical protein
MEEDDPPVVKADDDLAKYNLDDYDEDVKAEGALYPDCYFLKLFLHLFLTHFQPLVPSATSKDYNTTVIMLMTPT